MKPCIAIIGRPNVGKSTFFNRLVVRKQKAIVADSPGVTRDRIFADVEWNGKEFLLVDTGGMMFDQETNLQADISRQSMIAVEEADIIIFLMDGKDGVMAEDENLALYLRKTRKKIFWVVNKLESHQHHDASFDFYRLGMERFYPISAAHGLGINELMDEVTADLTVTDPEFDNDRDQRLRIAVVGKPNVGKSSLLNRLLGENRLVTSNQPGTTMDAIEVPLAIGNQEYRFFDTAGLRKKAKVHKQVEGYGNIATIRSIDFAQIVMLMIDATEGITDQDIRIAALANEKNKTIIFVFNKIDLPEAKYFSSKIMTNLLKDRLPFIYKANAIKISVVKNCGIGKIFPLLKKLNEQLHTKVTTGKLNRILKEITTQHQHPLIYHHPLKFYYITQISGIPPAFMIFCNMTAGIKPSYVRYMKKKILEYLNLDGIPVRIYFKKR